MSLSWKLLPLAAFAVLGAFALLPGGSKLASPAPAFAAIDCNTNFDLTVKIEDDNTSDPIVLAGARVIISPDPQDGTGTRTFTDNGSNDDSAAVGEIMQADACEVTNSGGAPLEYTITIDSVPAAYEDCDLPGAVTTTLTADKIVTLTLDNCEPITPTPSVSPTVGAAATVIAQASPSTVNCNGTSIVTIQVRTAGGTPVAVGTAVQISASIGSVSPSSGQTTSADGSVFVFFTAPSNAGGAATITAKAGNAQGTATVQVNCASATATSAPPPPTVAPGVISPPNTGDAGIASKHTDWTPFAGIAVLVATLIGGAVAAVKTRE